MELETEASKSTSTLAEEMTLERLNEYEQFLREESIVYARMDRTLFMLADQLVLEYEMNAPKGFADVQTRRQSVQTKIERLFLDLVKAIHEDREPVLRLRDRETWKNCIFDNKLCLKAVEDCSHREIKLCAKKSMPKFCLIFFVLGKIYKLLTEKETCTKREFFYQNAHFISDQPTLDGALNEISCLLDCPLYHLNLYTSSKGLISGPMKIITNRDVIDCGVDADKYSRGVMIPNDVCNIINLQTEAKFVFLIEKDAVFQKLLDNDALKKLPTCLFVTGKGMPDINTRALLKMIWDMLHIPILAFVDSDPWGIDIMCIYRFGSRALSHQADLLAVPSIRWIGPFPSEVSKLCDHTNQLTDIDKSKLCDLMERPYVMANKKIGFEIQYMLTMNFKAEIEDLEFSMGYLTNAYLPHKIALGDFI